MAIDLMPISLQARITLRAISPLFAINMLDIFFDMTPSQVDVAVFLPWPWFLLVRQRVEGLYYERPCLRRVYHDINGTFFSSYIRICEFVTVFLGTLLLCGNGVCRALQVSLMDDGASRFGSEFRHFGGRPCIVDV